RISALGVEPLGPDFTPVRLLQLTLRSAKPIKIFLMDQRRIAGVGNIQAAEALFLARIHPGREARLLDKKEVARLVRSIRRTLEREIERSRSENPAYLHEGSENDFRVYGRSGEPCFRCRGIVARFVQGGRSSYYCPRCQPKKAKS
ncbi:MAG: zinc finger domain-containing protein, partial [Vicinamibacteria bacterium]